MKAWSWDRYGPPDVLTLKDVDEPRIAPGEVLVRVRAASVNPYDWRHVRSDPKLVRLTCGLRRPKPGLSETMVLMLLLLGWLPTSPPT